MFPFQKKKSEMHILYMDTYSNNSEAGIIMNQYSEIFHFSWDEWRPFDFVLLASFSNKKEEKWKEGTKQKDEKDSKTR